MTEAQRTRIMEFMRTRLPQKPPCQLCGRNEWLISDTIWELREFHFGSLVAGGPLFPAVALTCNHCGHTLFISAIVTGVVPAGEPAVSI